MNANSMWLETKISSYASIQEDIDVEVAVIGAGIFGVTVAYLLTSSGKKVALLERNQIASGETAFTSGHLSIVPDIRAYELESRYGAETAELIYRGHETAIDSIEQIILEENIECDFSRTPGFLLTSFLQDDEDKLKMLDQEAESLQKIGIPFRRIPSSPQFETHGLRFGDQAVFNPRKYILGLIEVLRRKGCLIYENSEVSEFQDKPFSLVANGKTVSCSYVVVATNVPLTGNRASIKATLFQTKLASYNSYVIGAQIPIGTLPYALFWDFSDPYHYLRIYRFQNKDYAILGGEDHKTGQEKDPAAAYESLVNILMQFTKEASIEYQWAGQVVETPDGLPFIGEYGEKQFTGTGFSGNGLTYGTLAAIMITDAILGRENPWNDLYSPYRKSVRTTWSYVKENFDYPYYLIKDRLFQIRARSFDEVSLNEGKLVRDHGEDVACYRDKEGTLYKCSAVCPHMGCLVRWNNAELTWDCPCHGSRFKFTGELIAGPAETNLEEI